MNVPINNAAAEAQQASQTGDVLKPRLDEKYEQQASMLPQLFKAYKYLTTPDTPRVPTPRQQGRAGSSDQDYRQQQGEAAIDLVEEGHLSEKGLQEFSKRGGKARPEAAPGPAAPPPGVAGTDLGEGVTVPVRPEVHPLAPAGKPAAMLSAQDRARRAIQTGDGQVDEFGLPIRDFNFDYMETSDDVKALIDAVSELDQADIAKAKRGKRTNVETREAAEQRLADEMGEKTRILNRRIGETWNAEQMTAARKILVRSASRLNDLSKEINEMHAGGNIETALLLRFRRQLAVHSAVQMQVKGAQTEIARALQSFKIPVGVDIDPGMLADMLEGAGGAGVSIDMAKQFSKAYAAGGAGAASRFANNAWWVKTNRMWQTVYVNGLLSHTTTQWKNFFSAPTFMFMKLAEEFTAGVLGTTERGIRRYRGLPPDPSGVYLSDFAFRAYGSLNNMGNAWSLAYDAFKTNRSSDYLSKIEGMHQDPFSPEALGTFAGIDWTTGLAARAAKILGTAVSIPQRLLIGVDEFGGAVSNNGQMLVSAKQAAHRVASEGGTNDDAVDAAMMVMLDPNSLRKTLEAESRDILLTTGLREQGKLIGIIGSGVTQMQGNPFGRMIFAFLKAPTNDVLRTIERVPIAGMLTPKSFADLRGLNGNVARQKAYARQIVGTSALFTIYQQAMNGRLTGGYPTDPAQADMLPPGWKPWSFVFRAGFIPPGRKKDETDAAYAARSSELGAAYKLANPDGWPVDADGDELPLFDPRTGLPNGNLMYIPYAGMGPVSGLLAIGAGMVEHMRRTDDPEQQTDFISAGVAATFGYFENLPFLQGMSSVIKAVRYSDPGHLVDSPLGNMIPYTGGVPMPMSALNRNLMQAWDSTYYDANKEFDLRTPDDVRAMGKDEDGRYRWGLVGTAKGYLDSPSHMTRMLNEWQQLMTVNSGVAGLAGLRDTDRFARRYDVLGNEMDRSGGVRFDFNPIMAMYNLISPLKVSYGEKMPGFVEELIKLGMPLVRKRTHISAGGKQIKLTNKQQGEWARIAKNEVRLTTSEARFGVRGSQRTMAAHNRTFPAALEGMMTSSNYERMPLRERINKIKNLEARFFAKALPILLSDAENMNLREVIEFRTNAANKNELGR